MFSGNSSLDSYTPTLADRLIDATSHNAQYDRRQHANIGETLAMAANFCYHSCYVAAGGNPVSFNTEELAQLPAWVHWLAQDADGAWWGYEIEPLQQHSGWYENEVGRHITVRQDAPNPDWVTTLMKLAP